MESRQYVGADGRSRCWWCSFEKEFDAYHDAEWGYPVSDDRHLFEKLCLEGFQSGLSWRTILVKRPNFRAAFANFDIVKVSTFNDDDRARLMADAGIVRHKGKINATINNAARTLEVIEEFGSFAAYVWTFEPKPGVRPERITHEWLMQNPTSNESKALAKDLKKRGFKFVGPTTVYAFMQSMGIVNDHTEDCEFRAPALAARAAFTVPSQ